jgi:AbrB family looped-hinge helix DNA binding protein
MRVTSKGQVTIPKHIRQRSGIAPGSEVEFREEDGNVVVTAVPASVAAPGRDEDFQAYLDRVGGTIDLGMSTNAFMDLLRGE